MASVAHVLDAVETENVARKGSQASEDTRIAANLATRLRLTKPAICKMESVMDRVMREALRP
jgi:hypothetical protein